jgi:hypothetical protein
MFRTGGADVQADAVSVIGANGKESIRVAGEALGASVSGSADRGRTPSPGRGHDTLIQ